MFYRFPKENNRTVSKQARNFSKPWENDSTAQNNEESTEIAEFYLENKKKSKEKPMLKLWKPSCKSSLRSELPVEAWGYITPSASCCHVSNIQPAWELSLWRHVRFPLKQTRAHTLSTCGDPELYSNIKNTKCWNTDTTQRRVRPVSPPPDYTA